jgi:hypothetical protein
MRVLMAGPTGTIFMVSVIIYLVGVILFGIFWFGVSLWSIVAKKAG